jgi:hypothetical protein
VVIITSICVTFQSSRSLSSSRGRRRPQAFPFPLRRRPWLPTPRHVQFYLTRIIRNNLRLQIFSAHKYPIPGQVQQQKHALQLNKVQTEENVLKRNDDPDKRVLETSQLCSDSTKFTPDAFVDSSCNSQQSADGATETFKSTFSCPSGCYSYCPEGCNSYNEDYYYCSCDNDAISTEAECERKNTWFLIYVSILLAIRVSNA